MDNSTDNINLSKIDETITMLTKHANEPMLEPLILILKALKQDLNNESLLAQLADTWRNLGIYQGTVLTYVPYFYTLIPDNIFGDEE
jgi:hypothetical protein